MGGNMHCFSFFLSRWVTPVIVVQAPVLISQFPTWKNEASFVLEDSEPCDLEV